VDWNLTQRHTLALRGNLSLYEQDNARIGFLETLGNGGEVGTRAAAGSSPSPRASARGGSTSCAPP
jgi:hypothetical protein